MMKRIIIASTVFLLILLLAIFLLTIPRQQTKGGNTSPLVTPTTVPAAIVIVKKNAQSLAPYESPDFRFDYNASKNQFYVQTKTETGKQKFAEWAKANNLSGLIDGDLVVYGQSPLGNTTGTPNQNEIVPSPSGSVVQVENQVKNFFQLMDILNNIGKGVGNTTTSSPPENPSPTASSNPSSGSSGGNFKYTYYGQCGNLGDISLPNGCNLCQAGCGATTVAMIASSYLGNNFNPKTVVDLYKKNGYYLGCDGSGYTDAKSILEQLGLRTTSYISFKTGDASEAAPDFKKYLDGGWTIFTLASYCDAGCGHYFWVTQVNGNNILAYDPYYGQNSSPPFNENSKDPFPKYRIAFGVKK